jgi:hypothetical protein
MSIAGKTVAVPEKLFRLKKIKAENCWRSIEYTVQARQPWPPSALGNSRID